jgi:hypothetical protein
MEHRLTRIVPMIVVTAACLAFTAVSAAAQKRGVTPEDYFAFEFLNDARFSPDGSSIAFVVTTIDQKQNRRHRLPITEKCRVSSQRPCLVCGQ